MQFLTISNSHLLRWLFFFSFLPGLSAQSLVRRAVFIGNSYTYYNDLPTLVATMASSTGDSLFHGQHTIGGYTLTSHSTNSTTNGLIGLPNWDYMILQEQSQIPSLTDAQVKASFYSASYQLNDAFKLANPIGKTLFYMTWGRENGDATNCGSWPPVCTYEGMDSLLRERYIHMADSISASVSPVGYLWSKLREDHPTIDLYAADGSHPSLAGSYAAACCFYSLIFQKNPVFIGYNAGLDTNTAGIIKRAARTHVFSILSQWQGGSQVNFPLIVNEVLYDPSNSALDGDANGDGVYDQEEDSFIEFINTGSFNYDAGGLQIWDDTTSGSLKYTVPSGTLIPPNGALVVFGGGTPTGSFGGAIVLTASSSPDGLNFNNSGEVIIIKDSNGQPVLSFDSDALSNNPNESYTRNPDITGAFEQHNDNTPLLFSPGTQIDGTPFNTTFNPPLPTCNPAFNPSAVITGNYTVKFSWSDLSYGSYSLNVREVGATTWSSFVVSGLQRTLENRAPGNYEFYVADLSGSDYSCTGTFQVNCATNINYSYFVNQAPELGQYGRVRVYGTQGGKRLYDAVLVNDLGDTTASAYGMRARNLLNLPSANYQN